MEKRKNPEKDLMNKSGLYFNMGLLIAMMLCVSAFEYEVKKPTVYIPQMEGESVDVYLPPITEHKEIPKPKKPLPPLGHNLIPGEPDEEPLEPVLDPIPHEPEPRVYGEPLEPMPSEPVPDEPFILVEEMPSPLGGYEAFYKFVSKHLKYPSQARRMGIEGKVFVNFIIDENGIITDMNILKGIGAGCDKEVLRIMSKAPKWNPGKQRGKPVKVKQVLPIEFRLN